MRANIADEKIYRTILSKFTNSYWQYVVFAFLSKYMERDADKNFYLPAKKQGEYLVLLRDTVRYFYIRGLVYNNVNRIRDTVYKVYVAIHGAGDYKAEYQRSIDRPQATICPPSNNDWINANMASIVPGWFC